LGLGREDIGRNNFDGNNINVNRNDLNRNWNNNIDRWANRDNRPWTHPWYNHYNYWHNDWHHGYWNYWGAGAYPWAWFGAGAAAGWWASPGTTYVYDNPYYVAPIGGDTDDDPNYSQPIPAPPSDADAPLSGEPAPGDVSGGSTNQDPNIQQAENIFNSARAQFKAGDYQGALDKTDQAIKLLPSDATLHEFRALCLFALKKYQEAAAGVYAVLAAGPGWDWDTMKALYPNTQTYTDQLRALEDYKKKNPDAPDASFLLAYQYLVLGYPDQAQAELQQVVKLQPDNKLAAAILSALQNRGKSPQGSSPSSDEPGAGDAQ
jgi:tetratricopeptide (TPR) repeat protein